MNRTLIWLGILVGFLSYLFGEFIILVRMKAVGWEALAVTGCWTAVWLLTYTPFIGASAVELHEDRKRRETLPTSEDINEETDKILGLSFRARFAANTVAFFRLIFSAFSSALRGKAPFDLSE